MFALLLLIAIATSQLSPLCVVADCEAKMAELANSFSCNTADECHTRVSHMLEFGIVPTDGEAVYEHRKGDRCCVLRFLLLTLRRRVSQHFYVIL